MLFRGTTLYIGGDTTDLHLCGGGSTCGVLNIKTDLTRTFLCIGRFGSPVHTVGWVITIRWDGTSCRSPTEQLDDAIQFIWDPTADGGSAVSIERNRFFCYICSGTRFVTMTFGGSTNRISTSCIWSYFVCRFRLCSLIVFRYVPLLSDLTVTELLITHVEDPTSLRTEFIDLLYW